MYHEFSPSPRTFCNSGWRCMKTARDQFKEICCGIACTFKIRIWVPCAGKTTQWGVIYAINARQLPAAWIWPKHAFWKSRDWKFWNVTCPFHAVVRNSGQKSSRSVKKLNDRPPFLNICQETCPAMSICTSNYQNTPRRLTVSPGFPGRWHDQNDEVTALRSA